MLVINSRCPNSWLRPSCLFQWLKETRNKSQNQIWCQGRMGRVRGSLEQKRVDKLTVEIPLLRVQIGLERGLEICTYKVTSNYKDVVDLGEQKEKLDGNGGHNWFLFRILNRYRRMRDWSGMVDDSCHGPCIIYT